VLERPLHTERLTLRPATAGDADSTWRFRQLESVNAWLTGGRADLDAYRKLFSETARLTTRWVRRGPLRVVPRGRWSGWSGVAVRHPDQCCGEGDGGVCGEDRDRRVGGEQPEDEQVVAPSDQAQDDNLARSLWEQSARLVSLPADARA
jgi:hypothetical protein